MKVLFVYSNRNCRSPQTPLESYRDIHLGVSYISAVLRAAGHLSQLVVLSTEWERRSAEMLDRAIRSFDPQIIAFTAVSSQYEFIRALAGKVRSRWPGKFLLLGGTHASLNPQAAIADSFDAVCLGEGELPTLELAQALEAARPPDGIQNLWVRTGAGPTRMNPTRDFLADLDQLPFPDRQIWEPWIYPWGRSQHVILLSRGCPYNCPYCSNHVLRKVAAGRYVRFRSPQNIVAELEQLRHVCPDLRDVSLQSETMTTDLDWVNEFADRLSAFNRSLSEPVRFTCNLRVAGPSLDDRLFTALEKANVRTLEIGLESGSERVRREVLRRAYTNEQFLVAVRLARQHGMSVNVYTMVGLPGETPGDHQETVELVRQVCPSHCYHSIFYPYPGTDLYDLCRSQGLLEQHFDTSRERSVATLDLPTFSRAQIQRAYDWFEFRVYQGRRSFAFRARRLIVRKLTSYAPISRLFNRLLPLWHWLRQKAQRKFAA